MLRGELGRLLGYTCIKRDKANIGEMSDGSGKGQCLCGIVPCSTHCTCNFGEYQVRQYHRYGLIP